MMGLTDLPVLVRSFPAKRVNLDQYVRMPSVVMTFRIIMLATLRIPQEPASQ
jgi:hypothetical protein